MTQETQTGLKNIVVPASAVIAIFSALFGGYSYLTEYSDKGDRQVREEIAQVRQTVAQMVDERTTLFVQSKGELDRRVASLEVDAKSRDRVLAQVAADIAVVRNKLENIESLLSH